MHVVPPYVTLDDINVQTCADEANYVPYSPTYLWAQNTLAVLGGRHYMTFDVENAMRRFSIVLHMYRKPTEVFA